MWARRTVALTPITDVTSEELQHAISEAIADAIFLKTHDPAGVIALLLRQGRRVEASTNAEYVEKTALSSKLEAVLDTQPSATAPKPTPKASKWARVRQLHSVGHFGMAGRLASMMTAKGGDQQRVKDAIASAIFLRVHDPLKLAAFMVRDTMDQKRQAQLFQSSDAEYAQLTGLETIMQSALVASKVLQFDAAGQLVAREARLADGECAACEAKRAEV